VTWTERVFLLNGGDLPTGKLRARECRSRFVVARLLGSLGDLHRSAVLTMEKLFG
jgi:hypothetical protein